MNRLSASKYIPRRMVECLLFLSEIVVLNVPEWILGEKSSGKNVPPIEKRIESSIAASRYSMADSVARGGRRKVAVLTGGAGGLGLIAATAFAEAGYHLIIGGRAREQGEKAIETIRTKTQNPHVEFIYLDLASLKDVHRFAEEVSKRSAVIDLLVNNAGVMDLPSFRPTAEGFDSQFGINHIGHYLLTHLLLPLVEKAPNARIVMTASAAHYGVDQIPYLAITSPKTYDRIRNYYGSKLATVMFVRHLAKQLAQTHPDITVNCLHPGSCNTNLFKNSLLLSVLTTIGLQYLLRPPVRGARTIIYLSLSEEVEGVSGEYWFDERIRRRSAARFSNKAVGIPELGSSHL
ncbi:Retinol dehydrogenase 13 [Linnemannia gamsii]|uniref:Retinol dehydrogenase 13 n=1 Tax=Linnemannia gamsii TaxID=64522 RepID=A0ABQ7K6Z6_9FUNG|nr:Retinol dehydrogenase 13 [Linnemannia gamsii]